MKTRDAAPTEASSASARVIAEQLAAEAERFRRDAETETRTAALLSALAADGFEVLHDLSLPRSKAHVDHLVVGATGAFTIDARHYRRRLSFVKGMLWCGTYSLAKELVAAKADAAQVEDVLKAAGGGLSVVEPVMAVHALAGDVAGKDGYLVVNGVHVVVAERLLHFLKARPHVVNLPEVNRMAAEAKAVMRPAIGAKNRRKMAGRIPTAPESHLIAPEEGRRRNRDLVQLVGGLVVIALLGWLVPTALRAFGSDSPSAAASPTVAIPPSEFTCPTPGQGWAHDLRWPPGTDLAGHHVEWAGGPEGPWRDATIDPARGLAPLSPVVYRVRAGADPGSTVEATATFTAPDTVC